MKFSSLGVTETLASRRLPQFSRADAPRLPPLTCSLLHPYLRLSLHPSQLSPHPTHLFSHSALKRLLPLSLLPHRLRFLRPSRADDVWLRGAVRGEEARPLWGAWVQGGRVWARDCAGGREPAGPADGARSSPRV